MIVIDVNALLSVEAGASMTASGSTDRAMKIYGTLTNRGTITVTDVTSNDENPGAIEVYGVMNNYGTLNEIGAIKHGIMISGKLTNFPGGQISVENPYAFRIEGGGSFDNKSGAKLLARGTIASLGSDGSLGNFGIITCEGNALNYGFTSNEFCQRSLLKVL